MCRFVEIMATVFSRNAWRCVWHMIQVKWHYMRSFLFVWSAMLTHCFLQNDLVHGRGLDFALRKCVEVFSTISMHNSLSHHFLDYPRINRTIDTPSYQDSSINNYMITNLKSFPYYICYFKPFTFYWAGTLLLYFQLNSRPMRRLELLMLNGLFIKVFPHLGTRYSH